MKEECFRPQIRHQAGFSLVELSVVIVIVGLLVAGLVRGLGIIDSAEVKALVREMDGFQQAIEAYEEKYHALPGDMIDAENEFGAGNTDNGDGDYLIEFSTGEGALAWQHLELAGYIEAGGLSGAAGAAQIAVNVPAAVVDRGGYFLDSNGTLGNFMGLGGADGAGVNDASILSPGQALQIDRAIDDGVANTGRVRGQNAGCHSGGNYDASLDQVNCMIQLQLNTSF